MTIRAIPYAVIFDLDGLMIDSEWIHRAGWQAACMMRELVFPDAVFLQICGVNPRDSEAIVLAALGEEFPYWDIRAERNENVRQFMEQHGIDVKPGAVELVDFLARHEVPWALATSSESKDAEWKLERTKPPLLDRFPIRVCGDEVKHGKPAPECFLKAAGRIEEVHQVQPGQYVVIGDRDKDAQGAKAAGMKSIIVPDRSVEAAGVPLVSDATHDMAWAVLQDLHVVREFIVRELHAD